MARILVVGSVSVTREMLCRVLEYAGHEALEAEGGPTGTRMFRQRACDLVVVDINKPEERDVEAIREFRQGFPGVEIIALMASEAPVGKSCVSEAARAAGASVLMKKPFDIDKILELVERLLIARG